VLTSATKLRNPYLPAWRGRESLWALTLGWSSTTTTRPFYPRKFSPLMLSRTTHSAIAWAQTSSPEEYEVITHWPGQSGKDWGKVPSDICYTTNRPASNSTSGQALSLSPTPSVSSESNIPRSESMSSEGVALEFKW